VQPRATGPGPDKSADPALPGPPEVGCDSPLLCPDFEKTPARYSRDADRPPARTLVPVAPSRLDVFFGAVQVLGSFVMSAPPLTSCTTGQFTVTSRGHPCRHPPRGAVVHVKTSPVGAGLGQRSGHRSAGPRLACRLSGHHAGARSSEGGSSCQAALVQVHEHDGRFRFHHRDRTALHRPFCARQSALVCAE